MAEEKSENPVQQIETILHEADPKIFDSIAPKERQKVARLVSVVLERQERQFSGPLPPPDWQEDHKAEEREKAPETSHRWHNPDNQTDMGDYHSAQRGQSIAQTQPSGPGKHYPNLKDRAHRGRSSEAAVGTSSGRSNDRVRTVRTGETA